MSRVVPISIPAWRCSNRSSGRKNSSSFAHLSLQASSSATDSISLRADREEGLHRLDEGREGHPLGQRRVFGDIDRPEGGNRVRNDAALRHARQIFVLTDEARPRLGPGQAELLGKHRGERGSRIIVGADHRRRCRDPRSRRGCGPPRRSDRRRRRAHRPCRRSALRGSCSHNHGTDRGGLDGQAPAAPDDRERSRRPRARCGDPRRP